MIITIDCDNNIEIENEKPAKKANQASIDFRCLIASKHLRIIIVNYT